MVKLIIEEQCTGQNDRVKLDCSLFLFTNSIVPLHNTYWLAKREKSSLKKMSFMGIGSF